MSRECLYNALYSQVGEVETSTVTVTTRNNNGRQERLLVVKTGTYNNLDRAWRCFNPDMHCVHNLRYFPCSCSPSPERYKMGSTTCNSYVRAAIGRRA